MRSKDFSIQVKQTIGRLQKQNKYIREIAETLRVVKSTVWCILIKTERTSELINIKRPGCPRRTTDNGAHGEAGSSGGHGGAGSSEGHGRCKELRRPWWCKELRRPWWCRELRRPWQVVFHGRGLVPRPGHSSRNPSTPPKKNSLGKLGGIRSPPGLDREDRTVHDRTGQPSGARQTGQDIPQEQEALLGELGS